MPYPLTIVFQLTLFLNSGVLNLFGHVLKLIVRTQLLKLLHTLSAISSGGFTFGDNYRYLSYKYNIGPDIWMLSLNEVIKCISLYISTHENLLHSVHGTIIRDLCLARDNYYQSTHLFSHAEIIMLIEVLCTT